MTHNDKAARIAVTLPRGDVRGDPNLFVSVNGINYLLPRGKTSLVPAPVAEEIERAHRAEERALAASEALLQRGR